MKIFKHIINGTEVSFPYVGKVSEKVALDRINIICNLQNYEFLGFVGGKFNGRNTHLILKCNICGNIWTTTTFKYFCQGVRCQKCTNNENSIRLSEEEVIKRINKKIKDSEIKFLGFVGGKYVNSKTYLILKCTKCGYVRDTCNYHNFINSYLHCMNCSSFKLEDEIKKLLKNNDIEYVFNKKYKFLNYLQLDFYLPNYKIAIECQGTQHFKPNEWFGGEAAFIKTIEHDTLKRKLCEEQGITLLYYSNLHIDYPYKVYEDKEELLKIILSKEIKT